MSTPARSMVRTEEPCAGCGRLPYVRRDGTEYLYQYREHGPAVCSPRCDRKCNCDKDDGQRFIRKETTDVVRSHGEDRS